MSHKQCFRSFLLNFGTWLILAVTNGHVFTGINIVIIRRLETSQDYVNITVTIVLCFLDSVLIQSDTYIFYVICKDT